MIQRLPAEMGSIPDGCNCRSSDCQQLNQIFGFVVSTSLLLTRYARTNLLTHREGKSVFAEQCYALFISSLPFVISVVDFSYFSSSTSFSSSSSFFFFLLQHPLLTSYSYSSNSRNSELCNIYYYLFGCILFLPLL